MATARETSLLLDALRKAADSASEHRLHKSGKLDGLFPGRTGVSGDAAARGLREGFLEIVRTETRGKYSFDWVRITPAGLEFLMGLESPLRTLEELRDLLKLNSQALPGWLADLRERLRALEGQIKVQVRGWQQKLDSLSQRVAEALQRLTGLGPALPDEIDETTPWAGHALDYLDRRRQARLGSSCDLPELFDAVQRKFPELSVTDFHNGLRRLQGHRALRLVAVDGPEPLSRPEFALFDGSRVLYAAAVA